MKRPTPPKIGVSGVRGVIGESLTPQLVTSYAAAFGNYCGAGPILTGSDTRPSREMIKQAAVAGLLSVGCTPVDTGIVPLPALMLHIRQEGSYVRREQQTLMGDVPSAFNQPPGCKFQGRCPLVENRCRKGEIDIYRVNQDHTVRCWKVV